MSESMRIQVTLKGGAQIEFFAEESAVSRDKVKWTTKADEYPRLVRLDPDEVAAVVRLS